jgi:hypothetical protein
MSQHDTVCFLSWWVILFLCTEWGGCHQGVYRHFSAKVQVLFKWGPAASSPLSVIFDLCTQPNTDDEVILLLSQGKYHWIQNQCADVYTRMQFKFHLNLTVAVTIHIFSGRYDGREASTCITYSGENKYLIHWRFCRFSYLQSMLRSVIFIIGTLQLWETESETKIQKITLYDF